jgi:RNA ligase (TIGR02306 family)
MSTFAVTLEEVKEIKPHNNADRLELAFLKDKDFQMVVLKDVYKAGEKVVYFPIDSLLPQPLISFMGLGGRLTGKESNRVKTAKLRDEISQGLLCSVDKICSYLNVTEIPENLTAALSVEKYDPPVKFTNEGTLVRLPPGISMYDLESADNYTQCIQNIIDKNYDVEITEKLEGTNFSVTIDDFDVYVNQRKNSIQRIPGKPNTYWDTAERLGLIDLAKDLKKKMLVKSITLYGEMIGPNIQDNPYALKDVTVKLFEIKTDGQFLLPKQMFVLPPTIYVPVLFKGKLKDALQDKTLKQYSNGPSVLNPKVLREGVVVQANTTDRCPHLNSRIIIKQRSPLYLSKTDY